MGVKRGYEKSILNASAGELSELCMRSPQCIERFV